MNCKNGKIRKFWLAAALIFITAMVGGCGEPQNKNERSFLYRMHNKTDLTLRIEMSIGNPKFRKSLLTPDLVKTIFDNGEISWLNPLVTIYDDNNDESPLLEKYLDDFDIQDTGFDPSIRDKEERFYPRDHEHDYYIFLTPEYLTGDGE